MTVSYQYQVASSTSGGFTRLLLMWRGSLYKLIYRELFLFLILFGAISALYRHVLTPNQKKDFEKVVIYCDTFIKLIPLSFVLGFYVSYVAQRWWKQYQAIPWPDKVMHLVALYVTGNDEYGRMLRRALMRYLNLSLILVLRSISSAVKRRFPTLDHVVDSGFMTSLELQLYQSVPSLEFNTYWIPCTWFVNLLKEARKSHRLPDPQGLKLIMEEFNEFRTKCGLLWSYDWVSIPLVYTQVVTLATYSFFAVALVGRQYIENADKEFQLKIDIYLPVFTILQFFFFMGLLKVAEQLINPFGDDDEDFELNWLIDRHTKVSYLGVDTLMNRCPPLVKDIYFDAEDLTLPYTEAAAAYKRKTYRGSVANMTVPEEKQTMFLPDIAEEEEDSKQPSTPRTSSISLVMHNNDSPVDERRQISGSPQTTSKMHENYPETVLQFDIQEPPVMAEQMEQRHAIMDTVKKFSSMAKHSTGRLDLNRKPFFMLAKPQKMTLQPWPSACNLSNQNRQIVDTPTVYNNDMNPWRDQFSGTQHSPTLEITTPETPLSTTSETGIVSSSCSCNYNEEECKVCDCNMTNTNDNQRSEICHFQCQHRNDCQHLEVPTTSSLSRTIESTRPKSRNPKYRIRRHKSTGDKKKGIRWKQMMEARRLKSVSQTSDTVLPGENISSHAKSSPNLKLGVDSQSLKKDVPDNSSDSSNEIFMS